MPTGNEAGTAAASLTSAQGKLPVPVAVIMQTLKALRDREASDNSDFLLCSSSSAYLEVVIETCQGYVYTGKLFDIDEHYNVTLKEATVRRERLCDVERTLRRQKRQHMLSHLQRLSAPGNMTEELLGVAAERTDTMTRPTYLGNVILRSNNLLMMRFPLPTTASAATAPTLDGTERLSPSSSNTRTMQQNHKDLATSFRGMAAEVKKQLQIAKRKNREERRKRLDTKKTTRKG